MARQQLPLRAKQRHGGTGWFQKYAKEGPEGFRKFERPPAFDWSGTGDPSKRKRVFFDVTVDDESEGRIVVETLDDMLPTTALNFQRLAAAAPTEWLSYKNSGVHRIMKTSALVAGDVEGQKGDLSHSAMGRRYFESEGFFVAHTEPGIVSMVSNQRDMNGSQFYITLAEAPHLDGRCVAFGRVVEGMDVVRKIAALYAYREVPFSKVRFSDAGVEDAAAPAAAEA